MELACCAEQWNGNGWELVMRTSRSGLPYAAVTVETPVSVVTSWVGAPHNLGGWSTYASAIEVAVSRVPIQSRRW